MRVRYSSPAAKDLDRILDYIAKHSPRGARNVEDRIQATTNLIQAHPEAGRQTSREDTRRAVVAPYPYLIFYRVGRDEIVIRSIRHAARRPMSSS